MSIHQGPRLNAEIAIMGRRDISPLEKEKRIKELHRVFNRKLGCSVSGKPAGSNPATRRSNRLRPAQKEKHYVSIS